MYISRREGDPGTLLTAHHGTAVVQLPGHGPGGPNQKQAEQHDELAGGRLLGHHVSYN